MGWDPSVMRKFAATSHQRLIHQLRSELRSGDLAPPLPTTVLESAASAAAAQAAAPQGGKASSQEQGQGKRPRSFRERLNAVDMR
ncbi:MAG: hypothetical protein F4X84_04160 [Synechococcus sp. SB0662_bin_45]|nr:hypothetical protein [Cyanobacteria bacterium MAG IRC3_bin_20]MCY3654886.1 hypothetical protein [Cyanobacteria bacterium MAG IRC1_bin_28]MDE0647122.1 hypothetical protein [Cyanobacteria bacterium MAG IRC4_bin_6]MXW12025.1 hypothetical protein [Synechococcus sp. SB0668_bin_13]MXX08515.1 hypothetical protein [Synechococcus sp. SB0667_bin_8]MXY18616.1 hypothetical protein [Synechococcus sp. SB0664_bin_36]MXY62372.1 hypothetical protein [Synechococcus sp. SB0665_bin_28]MYE21560.1 hypothetical